MSELVSIADETVVSKIYFIRGKKIMLDRDLAKMYDVETRRLNEQVRRNRMRFPEDFMFQLTHKDVLIKLEQLEKKMVIQDGGMKKHENEIQIIFKALKQLLNPPPQPRKQIGFKVKEN